MDLHSIKKYAAQMVPYLDVGKSDAQKASKSLMKAVKAAAGKGPITADVIEKTVAEFKANNPTSMTGKTAAHVAIKLMSSRSNTVGSSKAQVGEEILKSLGAEKTAALTEVYSHYKNKETQRTVAAVALGASTVATIGAFAGAGPAGFIPLLVGMVPSATALAKSRKASHRLKMLKTQEIDEGSLTKAKAVKAAQVQAQAEAAKAKATEGDAPKTEARTEAAGETSKPAPTDAPSEPETSKKED